MAALVSIVDDDPAFREATRSLLTSAGYETSQHDSADEFIISGMGNDCDCVLVDVHLPGTSGPRLLRILTSGDRTPALVMTTGRRGDHWAALAAESGARFLRKPFDGEDLLAATRDALAATAMHPRAQA
jgi:two-component system, LuxR family, response regulator FixJ